jgi:hypothetical protein
LFLLSFYSFLIICNVSDRFHSCPSVSVATAAAQAAEEQKQVMAQAREEAIRLGKQVFCLMLFYSLALLFGIRFSVFKFL